MHWKKKKRGGAAVWVAGESEGLYLCVQPVYRREVKEAEMVLAEGE